MRKLLKRLFALALMLDVTVYSNAAETNEIRIGILGWGGRWPDPHVSMVFGKSIDASGRSAKDGRSIDLS